jgi:hypothetical protein
MWHFPCQPKLLCQYFPSNLTDGRAKLLLFKLKEPNRNYMYFSKTKIGDCQELMISIIIGAIETPIFLLILFTSVFSFSLSLYVMIFSYFTFNPQKERKKKM